MNFVQEFTLESNDDFLPFTIAFGKPLDSGFSFISLEEKIDIHYDPNKLQEILYLCNGHRTLNQIVQLLGISKEELSKDTKKDMRDVLSRGQELIEEEVTAPQRFVHSGILHHV